MGKRRRAREAAVQYHFWRDLQRGEGPDKIDDFWEFCPAPARVREFAQPLIEGMVAHLPEIDERIRRYCENYEFHRISAVDRNVLRLAIYEMLFTASRAGLSKSFRIRSRIPFTNRPESAPPYAFASSMASLMETTGGMSSRKSIS